VIPVRSSRPLRSRGHELVEGPLRRPDEALRHGRLAGGAGPSLELGSQGLADVGVTAGWRPREGCDRARKAYDPSEFALLSWTEPVSNPIGTNDSLFDAIPDLGEIRRLAGRYSYPCEALLTYEIGPAARARGWFTKGEFIELVRSKAPRVGSRAAEISETAIQQES
jgi:hypothetical protein